MNPPALPLRWLRFLLGVVAGVGGAASPVRADDSASPPRGAHLGDEACAPCHRTVVESYRRTAHFHTSSLPSLATIHGDFRPGQNVFQSANPGLHFVMEARTDGEFQRAVLRVAPEQAMERSERFDVIMGSGRKGQTYLYWDGNRLFQLPISYWSELGEWVNSPGYVDGVANFDRPIEPRCLECHASAFTAQPPPENAYDPASLVLGISCEKCHGPGAEHVRLYRSAQPPASPVAGAIVNPARLPRARRIEVCALCHAGIGTSVVPPGSFVPGRELAHYLVVSAPKGAMHIDVHGSQVQLLERSRCFRASAALTCDTCHDVHQPQRDLGAMAGACLKCHTVESCGQFKPLGHRIDRRCIVCHMPLEQTEQIVISGVDGRSLQPRVRNHTIAIYRDIALTAERVDSGN